MRKILLCISLLVMAFSLSSCDELLSLFDNPVQDEKTTDIPVVSSAIYSQYEAAFIGTFGMPAANQKWNFTPTTETVRIIVEDMNDLNSYDFDFNDVVFDAVMTPTGADIKLQAVGTTLPITIGGHEVHELFGVATSSLVNTGSIGTLELTPVTFSIAGDFDNDPSNIEVRVNKDGNWLTLSSEEGKAPSKIAVTTSFEWCNEGERISSKYEKFPVWVSGAVGEWYGIATESQTALLFENEESLRAAVASVYAEATLMEANQLALEAFRLKVIDSEKFGSTNILATNNINQQAWQHAYGTIARANMIIRELANSTYGFDTSSYLAEAVALRSFAYLQITMLWGDAPYISEESAPMDVSIPRTDRVQILNSVYDDLNSVLSSTGNISDNEHFGELPVKTLMAEILLSLGRAADAKPLLESVKANMGEMGLNMIVSSSMDTELPAAFPYIFADASKVNIYGNSYVNLLYEESSGNTGTLSDTWFTSDFHYGEWAALKRLGTAQTKTGCMEYELLLPIPIQELMVNPMMTQNPGY